MLWLLFKNCRRPKNGYADYAYPPETAVHGKKVLRDVLARLDALRSDDDTDDGGGVFITDRHFDSLSVSGSPGTGRDPAGITVVRGHPEDDPEDAPDPEEGPVTNIANGRSAKVSEKLLRTLQCPLAWTKVDEFDWDKNIVSHVQNKYGNYNTTNIVSSAKFSFEKYVGCLIVCCGLFKANQPDRAHDKLLDIWRWLDKLDDANEPFYLTVRDGLKHIVMSSLCHVLYATNRAQCQPLYEMIMRFNAMDSKTRAAVYGIRSAVCIEFGAAALSNAIRYAEMARDLDADTAYWSYYHSVAMTAHRQYLDTCMSGPTEAEFDAIQHAIIMTTVPNPYLHFHRMILMKNKMLYYYYEENRGGDDDNNRIYISERESEKIRNDFHNISALIRAIVIMEPEDPHTVVKCAVSLMTLPYFYQDIVHIVKQILSIAINIAPNDPSVIQAIKKCVEVYEELYDIYKDLKRKNEKEDLMESFKTQSPVKVENQKDVILEGDFKRIVQKHKKQGSVPIMDLIDLLDKFVGPSKWEIMAQICSYSIIFLDSSNLLRVVEQFMMLIHNKEIANSDIVTNHRSIFITDPSKVFNLAELVCNEIKLAITLSRTKNQDETQYYLDQLTEIMEVCQLNSKKTNSTFISDLIATEWKEKKPKDIPPRKVKVVVNRQMYSRGTVCKPTTSQGSKRNIKPCRFNLKSNKHTQILKHKT